MKDRVFSGSDVAEAVASAAANLGLPLAELRYVVLEAGSPGARGLQPTPARIAVLLQGPKPEARPSPREAGRPSPSAPQDPRAGLLATIGALAEAGGLSVSAELEDTEEAILVKLSGEDRAFFLEPDGRAEVLRATEHLLLRLYGAALHPRSVRLTGEGFRERRDAVLVAEAKRVAEEVRADGKPRTLPSLNAYERRVVHVALQDEPGVTTASSGEGAERRLTIAPAADAQGGDSGE